MTFWLESYCLEQYNMYMVNEQHNNTIEIIKYIFHNYEYLYEPYYKANNFINLRPRTINPQLVGTLEDFIKQAKVNKDINGFNYIHLTSLSNKVYDLHVILPLDNRINLDKLFIPKYGCIPHDDWWRPEKTEWWYSARHGWGFNSLKWIIIPPHSFGLSFESNKPEHIALVLVLFIWAELTWRGW